MRPLYQVILPNLCYIGGGGEYWLELKEYFNTVNMPFQCCYQISVQVISAKQAKNLEKLFMRNFFKAGGSPGQKSD